nr:AAA family ATPase [Spirochaeta cellobiosiphila]
MIEYLNNETRKRDTLTPKFKAATDYLNSSVFMKITKEIEKYYSLKHKFNFDLSYDNDINFSKFLHNITLHIKEGSVSNLLDDCGTGLQSLTIIALHRVLAKLRHKNIIIGLEEPETNLHPQAQRELINSIKNDSETSIEQIVFTTHSTVLIDNIDHRWISLARKENDERRGFNTKINKLKRSFFQDHNIQEFNYNQFHYYRNSDFFYANYIIFVESKNDAEVVKYLASLNSIDLDLYGISIVNIDGVKNLPYPFFTVKDLNLPYIVILDKDYFIPYLNDDMEQSRDNQGFPKYRYEYKTNILLNDLIPNERKQNEILGLLRTNHSKALDKLSEHNIILMNYNLEMDLLCSSKAVQEMLNKLNITNASNKNVHFLLTERKKAIKKLENIIHVLKTLENRNLPNSYKRIKNITEELVKKI